MEKYMKDYIEILDNDKDYKKLVSMLCQRRIRQKLTNVINEIVTTKRYAKFNNVDLSEITFDIVQEGEKLYVRGLYKKSYVKDMPIECINNPEGCINTFKVAISNDDIKYGFRELACNILSECVNNFIIISIECRDDNGNTKLSYSKMLSSYRRKSVRENKIETDDLQEVDIAQVVFEALNSIDLYKSIKSIETDDFIPSKIVICNKETGITLAIMDIKTMYLDKIGV